MARMKLGVMFSNGSGKLGNVVVNKGKGGTVVVRERVTPANPKTAGQMTVRNAQGKSSKLYAAMTGAQVAAWTAYAATQPQVSKKTGRKIKVSAINAFGSLAEKFLLVNPGGTVPMVPPTAAFVGDSIVVSASATTGQVQFVGSAPNTAGIKTEVLLQALKGKNRAPTAKGYRTKAYFAFTSGALFVNVAVPTGYYAAAYRFVNVATGQATPLAPLSILTVALSVEDGGAPEAPVRAKKAA